jgi:hypothetical protein
MPLCILLSSLALELYVCLEYEAPNIFVMFYEVYYMFNLLMIKVCHNLGQ